MQTEHFYKTAALTLTSCHQLTDSGPKNTLSGFAARVKVRCFNQLCVCGGGARLSPRRCDVIQEAYQPPLTPHIWRAVLGVGADKRLRNVFGFGGGGGAMTDEGR